MPPRIRSISYREIASHAGVSVATVSHAIRGTRHVSPEIKQRVMETVEKFNYHPNALARGLRAQSTKTIGIISTEVTNPFYSEITVAAEAELMARGYTVLIGNVLLDDRASEECKEQEYVKIFLEHRVDGLLFTSAHLESTIGPWLHRQQVPFVLLNRRFRDVNADYVGVDNLGGMRAAAEHLIQLGHRRIGFIGGFSYSSSAQDRLAGYQSALQAHSIPLREELLFEGEYDLESGYAGAKKFLSMSQLERPTAICATNDLAALGVMDYAMSAGFHIPQDLSVTGFDDLQISRIAPVSLTTVHQPVREMGQAAAELLLQRIENPEVDAKVIVLPCELIIRQTTAAPIGATGEKVINGPSLL